jgi:hypothetical protein
LKQEILNNHHEDSGGQDGGIVYAGNAYYVKERMWAYSSSGNSISPDSL